MTPIINYLSQELPLQKYIEYYYFFQSKESNYKSNFIHYPHYRTTLNVYKGAKIELTETNRVVRHCNNNALTSIVTNNRDLAKSAQILGPINCLGVVFKPLGLNYFIKDHFSTAIPHSVVFFDHYWSDLHKVVQPVFTDISNNQKVKILDTFFIKHLRPFNNEKFIVIVNKILQKKGNIKVNELESEFGINRRTLLRLFTKHLGCSISYFKQIVRFREALDEFQKTSDNQLLTELAYNHNYYDQSDFINHFKSLAGGIPKEVLTKLVTVGTKDMHWNFR